MKVFCFTLGMAVGCSEFDAGKYAPDPGTPPHGNEFIDTGMGVTAEPDPLDCDDALNLDWVNFGESFFIQNCNGCHHSETPDRYGAPDYATFDTPDEVWSQKGMVLSTAGGENPSMPPNGGTTETDRLKLEIWLTCGENGN